MTEDIQVTIEAIDDKSPHLQTVIALGDANKKTLSFFPKGAFRDYAKRREILVALELSRCIGYLLYSTSSSYNRITIIHLCTTPSHRGKGVAKRLVDYLIQITQEYSGIGLTCRQDYQLDDMWYRLGFVAQYNKAAKTHGKLKTRWWLDHGHPNLLSTAATNQRELKLCVVIDANIFFDLSRPDETIDSEESKSLLADWLQPDLDLWVTDEIFNKINTISNLADRKRQDNFAKKRFTCLPSCQNQKLNACYQPLKTLFSDKNIAIDESDLRYIARTMASDIDILVSSDRRLLDIADELYEKFRLSILRPTDLIIRIDELSRKPDYQPVRLAGTLLQKTHIQKGEEGILNDYFQSSKQGETKADFLQRLRRFLAEPDKFEGFVVKEGENQPLALVVYGKHKKHELEIPLLRVGKHSLAATLARHLIFHSISRSAREHRQFTRITDPYLEETVTTAIQEYRFFRGVKDGWLKANLAVFETASQLAQRLTALAENFGEEYDFCREIANSLNCENSTQDAKTMLLIEEVLWPAKIIDAAINTFIIPIKPKWAQDLFDDILANQTIFGATKTQLALNREAVYYKSKKAPKELKPGVSGRILWYVSDDADGGYEGVSAVRACSRLDEVVIGKPKELFRRFRHLGVYEWKNVFDVAENNLDNDIMAIRFSDTELLNNPIALNKLQEILEQRSPILSPRWLSKEKFTKIYALGTHT